MVKTIFFELERFLGVDATSHAQTLIAYQIVATRNKRRTGRTGQRGSIEEEYLQVPEDRHIEQWLQWPAVNIHGTEQSVPEWIAATRA